MEEYELLIITQGGAVAKTIVGIRTYQRAEDLAIDASLGRLGVRGVDVVDTVIQKVNRPAER